MVRQYLAFITQDDNPRLHRIPFFLFWVASYGLAWMVISMYERPVLVALAKFTCWVQGGIGEPIAWRKELLIGFLVGLTLAVVQRWLLQQRYGFVPQYWLMATIIGATIGGLGYPRLGKGIMHPLVRDDIVLWFIAIGILQAVVLMYTNRRGWLIGLIGIVSAFIFVALLNPYGGNARLLIVIATGVQAIGTGLVMMYLMANPRQGVVPKRDNSEKPKRHPIDRISPTAFVTLWIAAFYIALACVILTEEMLQDINRYYVYWNQPLILMPILGLMMGIIQHWLIRKLIGKPIQYWKWVTMAGWVIVSILPSFYASDYRLTDADRHLLTFAWFVIPCLLQAILLSRVISYGWIWIIAGLLGGVLQNTIQPLRYEYPTTWSMSGFVLSLITAFTFLLLFKYQWAQIKIISGTD